MGFVCAATAMTAAASRRSSYTHSYLDVLKRSHTHTWARVRRVSVAYVMTIPLQAEECRIQSTFERDVRPNTHTHMHKYTRYTHTHIHIYTHACIHTRTNTHTHSRTHALDLGNITSRASMTDVTSLGDFLENHTSHIYENNKKYHIINRHLHPYEKKSKPIPDRFPAAVAPPKKKPDFFSSNPGTWEVWWGPGGKMLYASRVFGVIDLARPAIAITLYYFIRYEPHTHTLIHTRTSASART